ncbi:hypothetical protein, unlikely [Trypanosoma brucei gambiense DAL972]|uniref:Uncharacterized protein n=1 Tax=Trypanosoma brucei gambiense (strain MHOM/CI/86/DAL972) TaxID=679716 RepID=D0A6I6_TRYB9|nr:hypothetical protein, unlikely [Trypanosoma brucei gambiense DAL972]CBH17287.1 hypothetical protein, unlikely [Trypanosoma brucei gambiense DAL972]|eukprot:XP_011779551.1 hypothetical protein, unlikely [Trypanosoma brucei gambiense DAL972]
MSTRPGRGGGPAVTYGKSTDGPPSARLNVTGGEIGGGKRYRGQPNLPESHLNELCHHSAICAAKAWGKKRNIQMSTRPIIMHAYRKLTTTPASAHGGAAFYFFFCVFVCVWRPLVQCESQATRLSPVVTVLGTSTALHV